jgi:hypothetical protein
MKHKSETFKYLTFFYKMVQTKFLSQVRQVHSDNGREFFSNPMQDFFHSNGMEHQTSCVDTPQQNGVVKRKHRHLLEVARALRFQAHLPLTFWGECILTTTYLINLIPTPLLSHRTPYEVLFNKFPQMTTYVSLAAFAMHTTIPSLEINLPPVPIVAFLLVIHTVSEAIKYMTLIVTLFLHHVM